MIVRFPDLSRVVMAAALACGLAACSTSEQKVASHIARAEELLARKDVKAAIIELRLALQAAPERGDLNLRIARVLAPDETKQLDALFFYQEAYRLDPALDEARLGAAQILASSDREQARTLVNQVLERDPANGRAHALISQIVLLDRDVDGAMKEALIAAELAPEDGHVQLLLGRVYQARMQVAQNDGRMPDEETFQGAVGAFGRADAAAEKAGDLNARIMAHFELARVQAAFPGHVAEAKQTYLELLDLAGSEADAKRVRAASDTAFSFAVATNDDQVIHDVLEAIVDRDPTNLMAWGSLAVHERRQGRSDDAVYQRLLEKQPRASGSYLLRAEGLRSRGELDASLASLEDAVGKVDDPTTVQLALVDALYGARRDDDARALVERMQKESPKDVNTQLAAALRAMRESRLQESSEILHAASAEQESLRAQELLTEVELRLGNLEAATKALNRGFQIGGASWSTGTALRLAVERLSRDWQGVLRSARELQGNGQTLNGEQQLAVIEALYETGRGGEARERLEMLMDSPSAPPGAALLYAQREGAVEPARVRRVLEQGLAANPDARAQLQQLALLDEQQGHPEQALARLDAYLKDHGPEEAPGLHLLRARLRAQRGDLAAAREEALAAFRAAPQIQGAAELVAAIYLQQGKPAEAIQSFEAALADGRLPRPARAILARFYTAEGRNEDAIRVLEQVVSEGGGPPAKNDLAFLLASEKRDIDRALVLAQEAVGAGADQPTFFDTLGYVYLQKGLNGPALDQFEQAIELAQRQGDPRAEYHFRKGLALAGLQRPSDAVKAFEAALSLDPAFPEAGEARASLEKARAASENDRSS